MKALFLDMDHTIIRPKTRGRFPKDRDDWELIPGVAKQIKRFVEQGYMPIIVTNQGGIQLKYDTRENIEYKIKNIVKELKKRTGAAEIPFYYAPTVNKKAKDRKPNPGMAFRAVKDHGVDLNKSVMVGDMEPDQGFYMNAGIGKFFWIDEFLKLS